MMNCPRYVVGQGSRDDAEMIRLVKNDWQHTNLSVRFLYELIKSEQCLHIRCRPGNVCSQQSLRRVSTLDSIFRSIVVSM